ncbi:MAG: chemotaxis protein CheW [Desulfatiglandales bacterium]
MPVSEESTLKEIGARQGAREGKYLTFELAGEQYGIGILKIREIIGMMPITPVPKTPSFVKGVINLRGKVIPVVDLRLKFGMEPAEYSERTCIIVVEVRGETGLVTMGIVVDSVSEVLNIKEDQIADTPSFGTDVDTDYILGIAKTGDGVKILLDIDKILSAEETIQLRAAA